MQTEHLEYVDLVDLHHRFLVQISRQIAPGVCLVAYLFDQFGVGYRERLLTMFVR